MKSRSDSGDDPSALPDRVQSVVSAAALLAPGAAVVVGVSGGVDSMVLLHVLHRLAFRPVALHVNYGLRGEASEADERLVRTFCTALNLPLVVRRLDPRGRGPSIQAAARDLRYAAFRELAAVRAIEAVAVAHHRDDQVETVLLNLFRGTGLEGLAGMAVSRELVAGDPSVRLIRPLLDERRTDIAAYAAAAAVPWRSDAGNRDSKYRRTAVRAHILPEIERHFGPSVYAHIARTAGIVRAYRDGAFDAELDRRWAACAETTGGEGGGLRVDVLHETPAVWQQRLVLRALRRWIPGAPSDAGAAGRIRALLDRQPGTHVPIGEGVVWRDRGCLRFLPVRHDAPAAPPVHLSLSPGATARVDGAVFEVDRVEQLPPEATARHPVHLYLDARQARGPVWIRRWTDGDRIRPYGMKGRRKVSDVLTDRKAPSHRKRDVLVAGVGASLLWVVGYALDESVRVPADQGPLWRISYRPDPVGVAPARGGEGPEIS